MFSLKKSIGITAVALILGVFAGFNFGKLTSKSDNAVPERITDGAIREGALSIGAVADTVKTPEVKESKEISHLPPQDILEDKYVLMVNDQDAGSIVFVASVTSQKPVWVAIHEDADGVPGKILGAQLFDTNMHSGEVSLLRKTENARAYYAVLHEDDGGRIFDYTKHKPIKDNEGREIVAKFIAIQRPVLHQ